MADTIIYGIDEQNFRDVCNIVATYHDRKVDKGIDGQLSSNDYTDELKAKLDGIQSDLGVNGSPVFAGLHLNGVVNAGSFE